jgi:hypothetical protein
MYNTLLPVWWTNYEPPRKNACWARLGGHIDNEKQNLIVWSYIIVRRVEAFWQKLCVADFSRKKARRRHCEKGQKVKHTGLSYFFVRAG